MMNRLKKFKEFKKKMRAGQRATLADVVLEGAHHGRQPDVSFEDDGNETPYADSSDDEYSFDEEGSDGQIGRKQDCNTPCFCSVVICANDPLNTP
jgi:hypothetical protein